MLGIFVFVIFCFDYSICTHSKNNTKIPIKIVNEYAKGEDLGLGMGSLMDDEINNLSGGTQKKKNRIKIKPASFSGPEQFSKLNGLCFSYLDDKYKFQFCPFNNFTQDEIQVTYDPFKGILGVWGSWIIENNTFAAMHFVSGAKCGHGLERNVKVFLKCGNTHLLTKVAEPSKCLYEAEFHTPLTCGKNAMLVYPRLPKELQQEWDEIETDRYMEILTQKGYDEELKRLFIKAGYILSEKARTSLSEQESEHEMKCEATNALLEMKVKDLEAALLQKEEVIRNLMEQTGA